MPRGVSGGERFGPPATKTCRKRRLLWGLFLVFCLISFVLFLYVLFLVSYFFCHIFLSYCFSLISFVLFFLSYFVCLIAFVLFPLTYFFVLFPLSYFCCLTAFVLFPLSYFFCLISCGLFLLSYFLCLILFALFLLSYFLCLMSLTQWGTADPEIDLFRTKMTGELFPIILGQTCRWLRTPWMNCRLFRDRLPASQVPQEQRFTTIVTIFWVSFVCFDLRFSEHHKYQNTAWRMFIVVFFIYGGVTPMTAYTSSGLFPFFSPNFVY